MKGSCDTMGRGDSLLSGFGTGDSDVFLLGIIGRGLMVSLVFARGTGFCSDI